MRDTTANKCNGRFILKMEVNCCHSRKYDFKQEDWSKPIIPKEDLTEMNLMPDSVKSTAKLP